MNTPLVLLERWLPIDIVNIIQTYIRNDVVHEAVRCHLIDLMYEQDLYINYIYHTRVAPNCYCDQLSAKYLRKYDFCDHCRWFERVVEGSEEEEYTVSGYLTCIGYENEQQCKLINSA
jgi:hypothetical protein